MTNKFTQMLMLLCLSILWVACGDDDEPQPITVNFTNLETGISSSSNSAEVSITFSRAASSDGEIVLSISGDLTYGEGADFFTTPTAVDNAITLTYESGDESVSFTVTAGEGLNIEEDKTITVSLDDTGSNFVVGDNASVDVVFSENFIAPSGAVSLDAGGENFTKQAFVDLSKLTQTTVDKYSWDLGFYNESGEFYVQLNAAGKVMARMLDKNDLDQVSASDTTGFGATMTVPNYTNPDAAGWVDTSDGNLTTSAFGEISATDADNKVFIVKRDGEDRNWKKVRVLRNGESYTVQYADIDASSFSSTDISKDDAFNFTSFDLDNGEVDVAPEKESWDIMYSSYTSLYPAGPDFLVVSYNDFITINRHNTSIAMVLEEDVTYENFSPSHLDEVEFSNDIDAQASSWRDPFAGIIYDDRFYLLNDSEGNFYKLKFTDLTSTDGERGYAQFKFEIVQ